MNAKIVTIKRMRQEWEDMKIIDASMLFNQAVIGENK